MPLTGILIVTPLLQVIIVFGLWYVQYSYKASCFICNVDCLHSFTTAVGKPVFIHGCTLAKSFFTYHQHCVPDACSSWFTQIMLYHFVTGFICFYTATPIAPRPGSYFFSSEKRMARPLFTAIMISSFRSQFCIEQLISFYNCDRIHTWLPWSAEVFQRRFLDDTFPGAENNIVCIYKTFIFQVLHINDRFHFIIGWQLYQVLYRPSFASLLSLLVFPRC